MIKLYSSEWCSHEKVGLTPVWIIDGAFFTEQASNSSSHLPLQDFYCIYLKLMVLTNFKQVLGDLSFISKLRIPPISCWITKDSSVLEQDCEWCSWHNRYIAHKGSHKEQLL